MANVNIPPRLKARLEQEDEISLGIITKTIGEFAEILEDNKLYFFEEYTDHGIKHIENVIIFSDNLITEATYANILTPKDIGAYVLSVVLHDIAMHIGLDGFVSVAEFDKFSWKLSYRKSIDWQKAFTDSDGNTTVRRNGKFGVGLLAAFLIGEEIQVEARKAADETGYTFTTSLNTPQINIQRIIPYQQVHLSE